MKSYYLILLSAFGLFISCADEIQEEVKPEVSDSMSLIPRDKLDDMVINSLKANDEFYWNNMSDEAVWSALMHSDSILTVGYQPEDVDNASSKLASIDINSRVWINAKGQLVENIREQTNKLNHTDYTTEDILNTEGAHLPFIDIKVTDLSVLQNIRKSALVRYVEPKSYVVNVYRYSNNRQQSDLGCWNDPDNSLPTSDYTIIEPNAKLSWNYSYMHIPEAWQYSTGQGITVGLIDTGVSADQSKYSDGFNSGYSSGRFIDKYGFYVSSIWPWASPDGPNDQCGHGTAMGSAIAAPRSSSGSMVGVAYNCNFVAVRGTGDVVIGDPREKSGVADALVFLADRADVKIISMSLGDVFSSSKVADAIRYAHGKGKLIFAAAGTSTSITNWFGVIFPANMDETVAVTGTKEGRYERCNICHSGSKVDYTVVMERDQTDRHPLTLALSGDQPSTTGGSSIATATAAGIAALVWSKHPSWTREQVLQKLTTTAELYPNRDEDFGWGTLNALDAVN